MRSLPAGMLHCVGPWRYDVPNPSPHLVVPGIIQKGMAGYRGAFTLRLSLAQAGRDTKPSQAGTACSLERLDYPAETESLAAQGTLKPHTIQRRCASKTTRGQCGIVDRRRQLVDTWSLSHPPGSRRSAESTARSVVSLLRLMGKTGASFDLVWSEFRQWKRKTRWSSSMHWQVLKASFVWESSFPLRIEMLERRGDGAAFTPFNCKAAVA